MAHILDIDTAALGIFCGIEYQALRNQHIAGIDLEHGIHMTENTVQNDNIVVLNGEIVTDQEFLQLQEVLCFRILDHHTGSGFADIIDFTVTDELNGILSGGTEFRCPGGIHRNIIGFHLEIDTHVTAFALFVLLDGTGLNNVRLFFGRYRLLGRFRLLLGGGFCGFHSGGCAVLRG